MAEPFCPVHAGIKRLFQDIRDTKRRLEKMITELVAVGTEILLGNIVNTNSAYLAEKCAQLGLSLYYQTVVGDNEQRMKDTIKTALDRSDVVILTGGLGPTEDDLTKEITAEVMGLPLVEDAHSRELLDAYLKQYEKNDAQRRITSNNYKPVSYTHLTLPTTSRV